MTTHLFASFISIWRPEQSCQGPQLSFLRHNCTSVRGSETSVFCLPDGCQDFVLDQPRCPKWSICRLKPSMRVVWGPRTLRCDKTKVYYCDVWVCSEGLHLQNHNHHATSILKATCWNNASRQEEVVRAALRHLVLAALAWKKASCNNWSVVSFNLPRLRIDHIVPFDSFCFNHLNSCKPFHFSSLHLLCIHTLQFFRFFLGYHVSEQNRRHLRRFLSTILRELVRPDLWRVAFREMWWLTRLSKI